MQKTSKPLVIWSYSDSAESDIVVHMWSDGEVTVEGFFDSSDEVTLSRDCVRSLLAAYDGTLEEKEYADGEDF